LFSPQRQAIPDIPAVYFIEPSRKNLEKIIQDLKNDFYDEYYLNFTSNISRVNLEYLAEEAVKIGKFDRIKQVYDQYLNFVVSDPNVFEIEMEKIWSEFNLNNAITEEEINAKCQEIASRLYNVIITMNSSINSIPILRIQPGGPAEIVGKKLNNLLNEYIINSKQFLEGNTTENSVADLDRPVLVLVDRNVDFTSVLSHSLYYECLVSEVFKLNRNTITLPSGQKILGVTDDNGMTVTGYSSSSDESLNLEIIEEVTQDIWFQPQTTYEYEQLNHIDSPLIDEDNGEINEE